MTTRQVFALQMLIEGLILFGNKYKREQESLEMEIFKEILCDAENDSRNLLKLAVFLAEQGVLTELKTETIMRIKGGNIENE